MSLKSLYELFTESPNSFQGQEPGEKIILFLRRHPIVLVIRMVGLLIAYFTPVIISLVFFDKIINYKFLTFYFFALSLWTILIWLVAFYSFTMYTLDVWIITDKRILDSNQHGFFNRTVSELHISRIQDITVKTDGPLQTVINFGDLFIQTAGTEERFMFLQIPRPLFVKDTIMDMAFPDHHTHHQGI